MLARLRRSQPYPPAFYLVVAANFFFFASFQWTYATLPGYIQELGGNSAQVGLAYGLFTLSAVATRPGIGPLVDRWGRKPLLLAGAAIFCLAPALYALVSSLVPFMLVRLLHGVGIAAFTTAYPALVADLAPEARRGEAIGIAGMTSNLALLVAPALGLRIQASLGYEAHFIAAAIVAAVSLVLLLPVREPELAGAGPAPSPSLLAVARSRPVWLAALGSAGVAVAYGAILSLLAPLAAERGLDAAGGYFSALALAMMLAQGTAGWLSDRIGRYAVAVPGMALAPVAMVSLAVAHTDAALLAAGAAMGLSWGLTRAGLDTSVVDAVSPEARGSAMAVLYTWFDIGVGAGSLGLGLVAQASYAVTALYAAAIWATAALSGFLLLRRPAES